MVRTIVSIADDGVPYGDAPIGDFRTCPILASVACEQKRGSIFLGAFAAINLAATVPVEEKQSEAKQCYKYFFVLTGLRRRDNPVYHHQAVVVKKYCKPVRAEGETISTHCNHWPKQRPCRRHT